MEGSLFLEELRHRQQLFTHPAIQAVSEQLSDAVAGGHNELFTIQAQE